MTGRRRHGGWLIVLSFALALMLAAVPLPPWAAPYRPEWVTMVLIYWCLALPERVGVGAGWTAGLLLDVMGGSLLGQHALAFAIVAYLILRLYQRIRLFPLWQQALSILILIALEQMISLWIRGITGKPPQTWIYWMPALTSMLLWPWLFVILRDLRRRFRVS